MPTRDEAPSREQLLKWAANAEVEARELLEYAKRLRAAAETAPSESGLPIVDTDDTLADMDVNTDSESVRRAVGRATRNHPAQKKLYKAGVTITELAKELNEGRPRVSAWFAEGEGNRPIPQRYAKRLLDKYGIPMSAWHRVAK